MSKKKYMKDVPCAYPFIVIMLICFAVYVGLSLCCSFWGIGPVSYTHLTLPTIYSV